MDRADSLRAVQDLAEHAGSRRSIVRGAMAGVIAAGLIKAGVNKSAAQTPAASPEQCPTTTEEDNAALIRDRYWAEIFTAGGDAAVTDLLAPDEIHHWGAFNDTTGTDAFIERLATFLAAFPDYHVVVDDVMADGDMVAARYTATGTHQGEWQGLAPTGKAFTYTGMNMFRFSCGKVAESWGAADHLGLLRQLGGEVVAATPTP